MLARLKKLIPADFFLRVWYHNLVGFLGAFWYGFPTRDMTVIGVTGTNGKTTVVHGITQILHNAFHTVGMASTVSFRMLDKTWRNETHKTTLGRFGLFRILKMMKKQGVKIVVIECSSHALSQGRLNGIKFDTAVFTNLSREHLDYHRTMVNYFKEKAKLFAKVSRRHSFKYAPRTIITNIDDAYGKKLLSYNADQKIGVTKEKTAVSTQETDILKAYHIQAGEQGTGFMLDYHGEVLSITSPLIGAFNVDNLMLIAATCLAHGISFDILKYNLETFFGVPARLEEVAQTKKGARVFIDYAVTPDSFKILFDTLRGLSKHHVIAVFGACGDRDKGKRSEMGEIAGTMCDKVIITNEEPYTEDPDEIIRMIWTGVKKSSKKENIDAFRIPDRRQAIQFATEHADKGDLVIITGMGDQTSMVVGEKTISWSDRDVIREICS